MNRFKAIAAAFLVASTSLLVGLSPQVAAATTTGSGNGMKVSPVRSDLILNPGESKTFSLYIQNVTNGTENLKVLKNDFVSRDESGAPSLLLNGEINVKHGLKNYISTIDTISIDAGVQKEVKVTVSIPKGVAGGGYYGAVRFAPASSGSGDENVSLSGSVGSLILVRVPGDITENLQVASFDARKNDNASTLFTSGKDITAAVRFRNSGNIQEQPFGKVLLKKGDKTLGTYEINNTDPRGNVLPDSIRKFNIDLKDVSPFGKYTLVGNFGYGTKGQLLSASTTFYVVPLYAIILGVIALLLILFLIFGAPKLVRNYNKKILRKAGRR